MRPALTLLPAWDSLHRMCRRFATSTLLMLLVAVPVLPQGSDTASPQPVTRYDRFKDETEVGVSTTLESRTVGIHFAHMQEFLIMLAGFTHPGQRLTKTPATVRLAFRSQARTWRFSSGDELLAIIDRDRVNFGTMAYSRQDLGAGRVETLRLDIPTRAFLKLARAKTAELRIGNKEISLAAPHLAALTALADRFSGTPERQELSGGKQAADPHGDARRARTPHVIPPKPVGGNSPSDSVGQTYRCPVVLTRLLPLRGFSLGMSLGEAMGHLHDSPASTPPPDNLGVRSLTIRVSQATNDPGGTRLDSLKLQFLEDRLYQMEATYSLGREWRGRPVSEFAGRLSRGVGVTGIWSVEANNDLTLECGDVRLALEVDEESFMSLPARMKSPMALAYFRLTDSAQAAKLKQRHEMLRPGERRRDEERRRGFKP